ncbi:hypothetical protein BG58_01355 [Caballeronia jiangsuensis]|nr:hypothetical protein BG58_01355 [Caballeronia jiangsuensis]
MLRLQLLSASLQRLYCSGSGILDGSLLTSIHGLTKRKSARRFVGRRQDFKLRMASKVETCRMIEAKLS